MTAIDTGTEDLRAEIDSGVAVITMNRPDRRNAFSQAMVSALGAVLAEVETDDAVGCVVLTGAGRGLVARLRGRRREEQGRPGRGPRERCRPVPRRPHPPPAAESAGHQRPPVEHAQA